jgi:hypothetical protein
MLLKSVFISDAVKDFAVCILAINIHQIIKNKMKGSAVPQVQPNIFTLSSTVENIWSRELITPTT